MLMGLSIVPSFLESYLSLDGTSENSIHNATQIGRILLALLGLIVIQSNDGIGLIEKRLEAYACNGYFSISFCVVCFFIALLTGILITQSGTGLSPDSTQYIRAGENIYLGKGVTLGYPPDPYPLVSWPPLYPIMIAAFMHMHLTAEEAARMIPILSFALSMFPIFFLGRLIGGNFTAYIACLISLVFTPLLMVTSFAWTEMIYIFLSLMIILALTIFIQTNKNSMLYASSILTSFALLTRYIGITLFAVGLISLALKADPIKNRINNILIFSCISLTPISIWISRNLLLTGTPFGMRSPSPDGLFYNIDLTVRTILKDFFLVILPKQDLAYIIAIVIILCAIIIFLIKTESVRYYRGYYIVVYIFIYLITLNIMASITDFDIISYRLTSPIYPFMLLTLVSFSYININHIINTTTKRYYLVAIIMFFAIIFIIQSDSSADYFQSSKMGLGYNSPHWKNNPELHWLSNSTLPENAIIYTNDIYATGFFLKRSSRNLQDIYSKIEINKFLISLSRNINKSIYIIYFKNSGKQTKLYNDLREMSNTDKTLTEVHDSTLYTMFKHEVSN
jgi:hypothetical protein